MFDYAIDILVEETLREHEEGKNEVKNSLKIVRESLERDNKIIPGVLEFFVDLLAGLIGGPAYFKSFGLVYYQSTPGYSNTDNDKDHSKRVYRDIPSHYPRFDWVRYILGILLWKENDELKQNRDGWLEEYWALPSYFEDALASVDASLEEDTPYNLADFFFENKGPKADDELDDFYTDYVVYLIKALFTGEDFCLLKRFIDFFSDIFGDEFFFFGKKGGVFDVAKTELQEIEKDCRNVSERCKKYSEQLLLEHRIILDGRLKDISAASIMHPIKRPVVPSGPILHSLYYGTSKAPKGDNNE